MEMNAFGEGIGIVKHVGRSVYLAARAPALSRCVPSEKLLCSGRELHEMDRPLGDLALLCQPDGHHLQASGATRRRVVGAGMEAAARMGYHRIAVFGGVYNNHLALAATLDDARRRGAEAIFCLGDLGGFGPHPDRVYPLLRQPDVQVMRGNYDLSLANGLEDCGCGYTDPRDNYFARISYAYTWQQTSAANRRWLRTLPDLLRVQLGAYRLHMCHGSPRQVNEFLWESTSPDGLLEQFCREYQADVILCTHTGIKWHRQLSGDRHAINVGVIGRPENTGETHVWYTLLTANPTLQVEFVPIHYDYQALSQEMRQEGLPEEFVETILTGWWTTCLEVLPGKERARGRW